MPRSNQSKSPHRKQRPLYTAPATRTKVLIARAQGKSKHRIAKELDIGRDTITRILSREEREEQIQRARSRLYSKLDKAAENICEKLDAGDYDASKDVMVGMQVFVPKTQQEIGAMGDEFFVDHDNPAELDYYIRFGTKVKPWPTQEELEFYTKCGKWPQEQTVGSA